MTKINSRQLCFIILTLSTVGKLFFLPGLISGMAEEGLIVSTLLNYFLDFMLLLTILALYSKSNKESFYKVLEDVFGKNLSKIILVFYAIFFVVKLLVPLIEEKNSIELTFYETQPNILTFIPIFIITFYISVKGIKSFGKGLEIVTPIFLVGVFTIILLSFTVGNYNNLLPFFAKKPEVLLYASYKTLLWFGDPIFILFLLCDVKQDEKLNKKIIIHYIIGAIIILVILTIFYAIFYSIAKRQFYAPLKMSKYSITLSNIGRFDYIATLLLSFASIFHIALPLLLASRILKRVFNFNKSFVSPLIVNLTACVLCLVFENGFFDLLKWFQNYGILFLIFFTYLLPCLVYILYRRNKNETQ